MVTGSVHTVVAEDDEECFWGEGIDDAFEDGVEGVEFSTHGGVVWAETVADVVYAEKVGDENVKGGVGGVEEGEEVGDDAVVYGVQVLDVEGVEREGEVF